MSGPAHMERIGNAELWLGDCREVLPTLPSASVHCVVTSPPYYALRSYLDATHPDKHREIGSEPTPEEYITTMVGVFREVRRILRPDGTCWINLGDSYATTGYQPHGTGKRGAADNDYWEPAVWGADRRGQAAMKTTGNGYKPKDLLMMPARLALALQADGWWLRSDIIWAKPNPMPESVTDRPTSAHEHVFLLTKSRRYFYDADAVREPSQDPNVVNGVYSKSALSAPDYEDRKWTNRSDGLARPPMTMRDRNYNPAGRSCRNVWEIATSPFSAAHFATFPPALVERCIKAGTSERGCCAGCGAPWVRQSEQTKSWRDDAETAEQSYGPGSGNRRIRSSNGGMSQSEYVTTGWRASCACGAAAVSCTVLDPFAGAGTTLLVADRLQRRAVGIELNGDYTRMAMARVVDDAPLFTAWPPAEDPADARMADLFEARVAEAAE